MAGTVALNEEAVERQKPIDDAVFKQLKDEAEVDVTRDFDFLEFKQRHNQKKTTQQEEHHFMLRQKYGLVLPCLELAEQHLINQENRRAGK